MAKRYERSDASWELIKDLVSPEQKMGRPRSDDRLVLHGILWILCSGAAWRDLPEPFGAWSTAYQRFRGWRDDGTFDRILERLHIRLNQEGLIDLDTWMIDSTAMRATRASSGAGKKEAEEPLDHALGRSRGGLTTRTHMVCDANGVPLRFMLSPGQASDITHAQPLLDQVRIPGKSVRPRKLRPGLPRLVDRPTYRQRTITERMFGWLMENRRISTRYAKLARSLQPWSRWPAAYGACGNTFRTKPRLKTIR